MEKFLLVFLLLFVGFYSTNALAGSWEVNCMAVSACTLISAINGYKTR